MELLFDQTPIGSICISNKTMTDLVTRHLPRGVTCTSIRFRSQDKLCLVLISDQRRQWNRLEDQRKAQTIVEDLKLLGVAMPRIQWIRVSSEAEIEEFHLVRSKVHKRPLFWAMLSSLLFGVVMLPFRQLCALLALTGLVWRVSHWLLREKGIERLKKILATPRRSYFR